MPEEPLVQTSPMRTPFLIAAVSVIALGIGAYAGMYYQKTLDAQIIQEKEASVINLQQALAYQVSQEVNSTLPAAPDAAPQDPIIRSLNLPKVGDRLCRNTVYTVKWKVDATRAENIRIWVDAMMPTSPLIDAPVTWNESGIRGEGSVDWKIGTTEVGTSVQDLPDGELYRIKVDLVKGGTVIEHRSSGLFAVDTCEG